MDIFSFLANDLDGRLNIILSDIQETRCIPIEVKLYCECILENIECNLCFRYFLMRKGMRTIEETITFKEYVSIPPLIKTIFFKPNTKRIIKNLNDIKKERIYICIQDNLLFEEEKFINLVVLTKFIYPDFIFNTIHDTFDDPNFLKVVDAYRKLYQKNKKVKNLDILSYLKVDEIERFNEYCIRKFTPSYYGIY